MEEKGDGVGQGRNLKKGKGKETGWREEKRGK